MNLRSIEIIYESRAEFLYDAVVNEMKPLEIMAEDHREPDRQPPAKLHVQVLLE